LHDSDFQSNSYPSSTEFLSGVTTLKENSSRISIDGGGQWWSESHQRRVTYTSWRSYRQLSGDNLPFCSRVCTVQPSVRPASWVLVGQTADTNQSVNERPAHRGDLVQSATHSLPSSSSSSALRRRTVIADLCDECLAYDDHVPSSTCVSCWRHCSAGRLVQVCNYQWVSSNRLHQLTRCIHHRRVPRIFPRRLARWPVGTRIWKYKRLPLISFAYIFINKTESHLGRYVKSTNFQEAKRHRQTFLLRFPMKWWWRRRKQKQMCKLFISNCQSL